MSNGLGRTLHKYVHILTVLCGDTVYLWHTSFTVSTSTLRAVHMLTYTRHSYCVSDIHRSNTVYLYDVTDCVHSVHVNTRIE